MFLKRSFDFICSIIAIVLLAPVFVIISFLIKWKMPGPILFRQIRIGQKGKQFIMYKFRTMVVDHSGNSISVKGEKRITRLGAVLRKFKLDELPEFVNIIKGNMSLVGPRPDVSGYADKLKGQDRLMLSVKPGLTGAASLLFSNEEELLAEKPCPIQYNNEVLWPEKVRINNNYIRNWTFWLDIKIILYTLINKKLTEPWAQSPLLSRYYKTRN